MDIGNTIKLFQEFIMYKYGSQNTADAYGSAVKTFLYHFNSKVESPKEISADMIISYLMRFNTNATRRNNHSAIKLFYRFKSKHGDSSKFRYIPYPEKEDKLPIHVSKEEFLKLISVCENQKHRAILCLLFDCGLRISEVINLRIADIDSASMLLNVQQAKGRKDRKVKLTPVLLAILRSYFLEYRPTNYLFTGQNNAPQYTASSCQKVVKQLCRKAGINKDFTPHKFRHGYAMSLLENGSTLDEIGNQLGHNSKKTTEIYARMNNTVIQKIESPLEQIVKENGGMGKIGDKSTLQLK